jgi:hypothetical protein
VASDESWGCRLTLYCIELAVEDCLDHFRAVARLDRNAVIINTCRIELAFESSAMRHSISIKVKDTLSMFEVLGDCGAELGAESLSHVCYCLHLQLYSIVSQALSQVQIKFN